jgi:hypothetical protein
MPIPVEVQHRYRDLTELFGNPLMEYLIKADLDESATRSLSMKFKFIGRSEMDAKPCVVVLCNTTALKKVKQ